MYMLCYLGYSFFIEIKVWLQFLSHDPGEPIVQALPDDAETTTPQQCIISTASQYRADDAHELLLAWTDYLLHDDLQGPA